MAHFVEILNNFIFIGKYQYKFVPIDSATNPNTKQYWDWEYKVHSRVIINDGKINNWLSYSNDSNLMLYYDT